MSENLAANREARYFKTGFQMETMTGAQFDALSYDEGRRWELIDGELTPVTSPTLRHQRIVFRILLAFEQYLKAHHVDGLAFGTNAIVRRQGKFDILRVVRDLGKTCHTSDVPYWR